MTAFSDGVVTIIMVLESRVPHADAWAVPRRLLSVFPTYRMSFIYLAIRWNNHHHLPHTLTRFVGLILGANPHPLFWLSLV